MQLPSHNTQKYILRDIFKLILNATLVEMTFEALFP